MGIIADLKVKVARFALDRDTQQVIDVHQLYLFNNRGALKLPRRHGRAQRTMECCNGF
jgi:hypothetical protein